MAMLPNPMIAPRSILLEPVLADDGVQRLVQDCEPGQCLLFADHERRVDPDRGRVRHRDQAAPQALLVQRLGDGLRERLLRRPVTDELDAEQQRAVLARDRLDRSDEPLGRHHVAGGALNGLDDDRADLAGGLIANDVAHKLGARDAAVRIAELERAAVAVGIRRQVSTRRERPQVMLELAPDETEHTTSLAVKPAPEADDLGLARAALANRKAASTASAPPENIWMRVRPAGVTEASSSRNLARVSVVKLPNVSRSTCRFRAST